MFLRRVQFLNTIFSHLTGISSFLMCSAVGDSEVVLPVHVHEFTFLQRSTVTYTSTTSIYVVCVVRVELSKHDKGRLFPEFAFAF